MPDETYVRPVEKLPINSLDNRVVSSWLTLANGQRVFGMLGNLDLFNLKSNLHFLGVSIFNTSEQLFHLARYHDVDYMSNGPSALGKFLDLPVEAVFPMRYDISDVAIGHPECISGIFPLDPQPRLSERELIDMAVEWTCKPQD